MVGVLEYDNKESIVILRIYDKIKYVVHNLFVTISFDWIFLPGHLDKILGNVSCNVLLGIIHSSVHLVTHDHPANRQLS